MALSHKLELRVGQSLVMTPQLMQAIKLLQLSNLDLVAYVEAELERNPLLEREDANPVAEERGTEAPDEPFVETGGDGQESDWLPETMEPSRQAIEEGLDTSLENVFPDDKGPDLARADSSQDTYLASYSVTGSGGRDDDDMSIDSMRSADISLHDHLEAQIGMVTTDATERLIARMLIDGIDDAGYLTVSIDDVAAKLGTTPSVVEAVLVKIHTLDPVGVGARSLAECLAIQLREKDRFDPAMAVLVANLELLARRDIAALRRLCKVDDEDITDMIAEIRQLNPKPGLAFGGAPMQIVVPDVLVRPAPDQSWIIELNTETLPKVLINQSYYTRISRNAKADGEKAFIAEAMQTATWLTRALDQRARTIIKVASEIVRQQDAFLALGVAHLRPLNLKTVADAVGMHESTISRVTSNKFMATPRGIFELKYFFTTAIANNEGGESHSAEAVRYKIKQMIDAEAPDKVLSDDAIVDSLKEAGIDIARRTVAKYREALRIPSSVQRRREKMSEAV